ncbi:MAG: PAS domain S-box protein [Candidatus Margulisiibacteriota bacterium]|jgi:PAS domain S-box-containing protein
MPKKIISTSRQTIQLNKQVAPSLKNILFIEDDGVSGLLQSKMLAKHGYIVTHVLTGEKAIKLAAGGKHFDLVISDIELGKGLDGPATVRELLKIHNVPVIFMSGHNEKDLQEKIGNIPNYGHVIKNIGDFALHQTISWALRLFEADQAMATKTEALKESEEKYSVTFLTHRDAININAMDGIYIDINEGFTGLTGYNKEEVVGLSSTELNIWAIPEDRLKLIKGLQEHGRVDELESVFRCKDGSFKNAVMSARTIMLRNTPFILSITRDITESKKAEAALRESELKYRRLIENSHDVIYTITADGNFTFISPSWTAMLGHQLSQVEGQSFQQFVHPDDLYLCQAWLKKVIETGERQEGFEYRVKHADGSWRWHTSSAVPLRDSSGAVVGFEGTARDITGRKIAELALQKIELRQKAILENAPVAIIIIQDGKFIYLNAALDRHTGWAHEELQDRGIAEFVHKEDIAMVLKNYQQRMTGDHQIPPYTMRVRKKDGNYVYAEVNGAVINIDGKPAMLGFLADITERKLAEDKVKTLLVEKELILREVHHRIKNNMATMINLLALQIESQKDNNEVRTALESAQNRLRSMGVLYEKLYRSDNIQEMSAQDYLPVLAGEIVNNLSNGIGVRTDTAQVADVILEANTLSTIGIIVNELLTNIMKYAFKDIDHEKMIKVSLQKKAQGSIELIIADNGRGLPPGIDLMHSNGFGMTLINMLAEQLGGTITVNSKTGQGTEWKIEFRSGT